MNKFLKIGIVTLVIVIAALIVIPKLSQQAPVTTESNDGSSLTLVRDTLKNGKPTLLLLRSSN